MQQNAKRLFLKCFLADNNDAAQGTKPSVYLYDDPVSGPQVRPNSTPKNRYSMRTRFQRHDGTNGSC